ncbi:MAG: fused MFS/spermidine synthase [Pseudomonadota bacterium]
MSKATAVPIEAERHSFSRFGASPYVATAFLSAVLVFLVQPMFAKMATPLLGGAPNVWNVSLVCFQAALLLGYAYAHVLNHFVASLRRQVAIHAGLLVLAALVLPFQLSTALGDPDPLQPTFWLIGVFAISIAPPFAVISATAPLIQSWYSRSGREDAHDPYHLYSASNVGSVIGLIAYPVLLEPFFPVAAQTMAWTLGYGALAVLLIASGVLAYRTGGGARPAELPAETELKTETRQDLWKQRLWWLTCAFIPSSLLVGVTTHIATDIASVPFLWALPLALYISTFIIVFSKTPAISLPASNRLLPMAVALTFFALPSVISLPLIISLSLSLMALFLAALVGHGILAEQRPVASRLTEFYLLMSLGGVLGGAFNALLVPVLFSSVFEYPLMLLAVLLIRPGLRWMGQGRTRVWAIAAVGALVGAILLRLMSGTEPYMAYRALLLLAVVAVVLSSQSRLGPVIAAASAWGIGMVANPLSGGVSDRTFFGVVKVIEQGEHRVLMHGTTAHGAQYISGPNKLRPTTYYAPETPIGEVFAANAAPGRVGVVGLGTGSVACFAQPDQDYVYYEIDPLVAQFASDERYFTYLSDCTPDAEIILGDGRLSLAAEPKASFNLILIDAFSSASVPAHLLTREAVDLYMSRLSEDGVVVMHVSNKHMNLTSLVARIAGALKVEARYKYYSADPDQPSIYHAQSSQVVVLAHSPAAFETFALDDGWSVLESDGKRPWSDDYSNVIGAMLDNR